MRIFLRKTILKNICERLLLNLLKKILQHRCFPVNFTNYLRISILESTYERLVLKHRCEGFSLIKLQVCRSGGLPVLERDSSTGHCTSIFLWILCNFYESLFVEHLLATTSHMVVVFSSFLQIGEQALVRIAA